MDKKPQPPQRELQPPAHEPMLIEIAHTGPGGAAVKRYRIHPPATIADALLLAAADAEFFRIDLVNCAVGIFGRVARREQMLADGDRIEIYRALAIDPKSARRARARDMSPRNRGAG
jgi:putative ubiquitin-RnfH superfamily antitoxin RatB of RatAB toxin-antitoxin module